jgi:hypothetical protein
MQTSKKCEHKSMKKGLSFPKKFQNWYAKNNKKSEI